MNRREKDILYKMSKTPYITQREMAQINECSLGAVNQSIRNLQEKGYLDAEKKITDKARTFLKDIRPKNAIILAAGYGMRMVPINTETPKGLLEIYGEPLIERIIKQLHEVGINEIYIVVGFMKECYEYLMDEYGVELIINTEYSNKNNLHSLNRAIDHLGNTYIIPCDVWCKNNPFAEEELYSWYMITEQMDYESNIKMNRKKELIAIPQESMGNSMIGISYLDKNDAMVVCSNVQKMCKLSKFNNSFWEEALYISGKMLVSAKLVSENKVIEINTYEQLRELDNGSSNLNSKVIEIAASALKVDVTEIAQISLLKKGMTNRSFLFNCKQKKYIMRIPGEGTEQLINRAEEAEVYTAIKEQKLCDPVIYLDQKNGYKITEYLENARVCDAFSEADITKCMFKLKYFHELALKVEHEFDIFGQIEFYESLWKEKESVYKDYEDTKEKVFALKEYIELQPRQKVLTHIDAVPDNFLFYTGADGAEEICLIDWEYAAMQDPHVDIAMFCIYSLYNREQIDKLIDIYFEGKCQKSIRIKIYCYIAACGLLWSNWCEYKRCLGIEFGEYSIRQYRYAKEYYRIVKNQWMDIKNV